MYKTLNKDDKIAFARVDKNGEIESTTEFYDATLWPTYIVRNENLYSIVKKGDGWFGLIWRKNETDPLLIYITKNLHHSPCDFPSIEGDHIKALCECLFK